ncbi:hypothetical protein HDU86_006816 [Geranomyces michiganensis]|nr:hypothetical protein HDU86_006816 [Geranomyces michiganensis]
MPATTKAQAAMCRYIAASGRDLVLLLMSLLTDEAGDEELEVLEVFASALFKGLSDREKCQAPNATGWSPEPSRLALYADLVLFLPATFRHRTNRLPAHEPIRFLASPLMLIRCCVVPVVRACVWSHDRSSTGGARVMRDLEQFLLAWATSLTKSNRGDLGGVMSQIARLLRMLANSMVAAPRLKNNVGNAQPLLISDTLASSLLGWAKPSQPSQAVHLLLIPLLEQCLAVQDNWPNAEKIIAGLYAAEEQSSRETDGPGSVLWITRWLILTACWRRDTHGLAAAFNRQQSLNYGLASVAFEPSEIKVGKMPTAEAETVLRLFCIRLLGMARTGNHQITLCLLSLFDDTSLRVRRTVAHAIAYRSLNLLHQDRDPLAYRMLRHHHHRRTKRCSGHLHPNFTNPFLYILSCAEDACSTSAMPADRAVLISSVWRSSANERETFGLWAAETAAHIADCNLFNADTMRRSVADTCDRIRTLCQSKDAARGQLRRETLWEVLAGLLSPWVASAADERVKNVPVVFANMPPSPPPLDDAMQNVLAALLVFRRDSSTVLRMQCLKLCEKLGGACGEAYHSALRDVVTGMVGQRNEINDEPRVADLVSDVLNSVRKNDARRHSHGRSDGRHPLPMPILGTPAMATTATTETKTCSSSTVKSRMASKSPEKKPAWRGAGAPTTASTSLRKPARSLPTSPAKNAHRESSPKKPATLSLPRQAVGHKAPTRAASPARPHTPRALSPPVGEAFADASGDDLDRVGDFYSHLLDSPPGEPEDLRDTVGPQTVNKPARPAPGRKQLHLHAADSSKRSGPLPRASKFRKPIASVTKSSPEDDQPDGIMRLSEIQDDDEKDATPLEFGKDEFLDEWSGANDWAAVEALLVPKDDPRNAITREGRGHQGQEPNIGHNWMYGIDREAWKAPASSPRRPSPPPRNVQAVGRDAGSRTTTTVGVQWDAGNDNNIEAQNTIISKAEQQGMSPHLRREKSSALPPRNIAYNPIIPNVSLNSTLNANSLTQSRGPFPQSYSNNPVPERRLAESSDIMVGPDSTFELSVNQLAPRPSVSFAEDPEIRRATVTAVDASGWSAGRSSSTKGINRATNTTPPGTAALSLQHDVVTLPEGSTSLQQNSMLPAGTQVNELAVQSKSHLRGLDKRATPAIITDMQKTTSPGPLANERRVPAAQKWSRDFSEEWDNWQPQTGADGVPLTDQRAASALLVQTTPASTRPATVISHAVQQQASPPPVAVSEDEDTTPPWSIAIQHPPELSAETTPTVTVAAPSTVGGGHHVATAFLRPSLRRAALALLSRLFAASLHQTKPPLHPLLKSAFTLDPSLLVALLRRAVGGAASGADEKGKHQHTTEAYDDEDEAVAAALARLAPCSRIVEELERDIGPLTVAQVLLVLRDQVVVDRICRKGAAGGGAAMVPWAAAEDRGYVSSFAAAVAV